MDDAGWVFVAIGLCSGGGALAYFLARRRVAWAIAWCLSLAALGVGLFVAASGAQGWDGLAYVAIAILFVAPTFVGSAIGTLVGFFAARRKRARAELGKPD